MRLDKLTTAFQQALQDAQSAAVARDNPYIEPAHLLAAMLQQPDGPRSLLERAGAKVSALDTAMETAGQGHGASHRIGAWVLPSIVLTRSDGGKKELAWRQEGGTLPNRARST